MAFGARRSGRRRLTVPVVLLVPLAPLDGEGAWASPFREGSTRPGAEQCGTTVRHCVIPSSESLSAQRGADVMVVATIVICAAGAVASALLTIDALAFEIATPVAVVAILVQSLWLHLVSRRLRGTAWSTTVVRLGWWAPVAQAVGAVVVSASLALPWSTPPQLVVMVVGIVVGLPAWAAWPLWFHLAAREALRHGVPVRPHDHPRPQENLPCPTSTASTTSP